MANGLGDRCFSMHIGDILGITRVTCREYSSIIDCRCYVSLSLLFFSFFFFYANKKQKMGRAYRAYCTPYVFFFFPSFFFFFLRSNIELVLLQSFSLIVMILLLNALHRVYFCRLFALVIFNLIFIHGYYLYLLSFN